MNLLGLDTATAATAVALRTADGALAEARDDPAPREHPGHATRLLAMADGLLRAADLDWAALDRVAVGVGPGRFTGLRVGVATARGLAHSLSLELVGVSSLEALAWTALADAEIRRPDAVLAVIDARRGEVFAAAYERGGDASARELVAPRALAPERLGEVLAPAQRPGARWLALGDGALRYSEQLAAAGLELAHASSSLHAVSAAAVCELAARRAPASRLEAVLPQYLRRPDAELALRGAAPARAAQR